MSFGCHWNTQGAAGLVVAMLAAVCFADTWQVPGDAPSIQAAVDAAADGDEIVVAPGTYAENLLVDKSLTIRSSDPEDAAVVEATVVDGDGLDCVIVVVDAPAVVLSGLTIRNGAGLYDPILAYGGGVTVHQGGVEIRRCVIRNNQAGTGGGLLVGSGSNARVANSTIVGNHADLRGGGICDQSFGATVIVEDSVIADNTTGDTGGGIAAEWDSRLVVRRSFVCGNTAVHGGGASYTNGLDVELDNCVVAGNTASIDGGGIWRKDSRLLIDHCTVHGNYGSRGGGLFADSASYPDFVRIGGSIFWGNDAARGAQVALDGLDEAPDEEFAVRYSLIEGGQVGLDIDQGNWQIAWGDGNLDTDPLFLSADGLDGDASLWRDNDYRLRGTSPCVNAGDPGASIPPDAQDIAGQRRVRHGRPDVGSYEYCSPGDINGDDRVDHEDVLLIAESWNSRLGEPRYNPACDLDADGAINVFDIFVLAEDWGRWTS